MSLLRHRLKLCGFKPVQFSYPSIRCSLKENAARLQRFVQSLENYNEIDTIHFVAHSLGGLLLRQFFYDYPEQLPGRVVTLGTPHQGSQAARHLAYKPIGKWLLGKSYHYGLRGDVPLWGTKREIAVYAGCVSVGVGRLLTSLDEPNDGTVTVAETNLQGMKCHRIFSVTHMGLLFSDEVAHAVCTFLQEGK